MSIAQMLKNRQAKLAVVGLGYVGLPLAVAFAQKTDVIGFDKNSDKIDLYRAGVDPTNEVGTDALRTCGIFFTAQEHFLREASFLLVAVPTPVTKDKTPDLAPIEEACRIVGRNLQKGAMVAFESTVYPGVTEEICIPLLEQTSHLVCGRDFFVAYSPERVNPGDKTHRVATMRKVVSATSPAIAKDAAEVYELIVSAGTYLAGSIKVAEAAKLVENAQRDVNIAFMNELSMILDKMEISTREVIETMNTKWNALGFTPGLVGGHCIGVDPYYLIYKAKEMHFRSSLLQTGRKINDDMGRYVADRTIKELIGADKLVRTAKVCIMGLSYKENCPDTRNTMVMDILQGLAEYGIHALVCDPAVDPDEVQRTLGIDLAKPQDITNADCVIFAVAHDAYRAMRPADLAALYGSTPKKVLIDIKNMFSRSEMEQHGFQYWSL